MGILTNVLEQSAFGKNVELFDENISFSTYFHNCGKQVNVLGKAAFIYSECVGFIAE